MRECAGGVVGSAPRYSIDLRDLLNAHDFRCSADSSSPILTSLLYQPYMMLNDGSLQVGWSKLKVNFCNILKNILCINLLLMYFKFINNILRVHP